MMPEFARGAFSAGEIDAILVYITGVRARDYPDALEKLLERMPDVG